MTSRQLLRRLGPVAFQSSCQVMFAQSYKHVFVVFGRKVVRPAGLREAPCKCPAQARGTNRPRVGPGCCVHIFDEKHTMHARMQGPTSKVALLCRTWRSRWSRISASLAPCRWPPWMTKPSQRNLLSMRSCCCFATVVCCCREIGNCDTVIVNVPRRNHQRTWTTCGVQKSSRCRFLRQMC